MKYGIRFQDLAGRAVFSDDAVIAGMWLKSFDVEAFDGRGECEWTAERAEALAFDSAKDAVDAYRATSQSRPLREDGQPNRPLTAFTVSIDPLRMGATDDPLG